MPKSTYFHRNNTDSQDSISSEEGYVAEKKGHTNTKFKIHKAFFYLASDFKSAFINNAYVLKWSIWWALATCGYLQVKKNYLKSSLRNCNKLTNCFSSFSKVTSYSQLLWQKVLDKDDTLYNGFVEFSTSLIGT